MLVAERGVHAQVCRRLLEAKVLHDMRVIQVLQRLAFQLQRFHDRNLSRVVLVARRSWNLDLLDSDHFTRRRVEGKIDFAVRSLADELTTNPTEDGYMIGQNP